MSRTLDSAKEICAVALKFNAHSWDDPEAVTDDAVLQRADELVDVALQASAGGSINDAVMEILFAAQVEPQSVPSREAYTQRFGAAPATAQTNGHASEPQPAAASAFGQPTSQPSAPSGTQDASSPEQVSPVPAETPAAGENSIEDVFPGYDDLKVKDIKAAILASAASGDLSPEEWERIKTYEAANEERKTILSLEPEWKPEPEPPMPSLVPVGSTPPTEAPALDDETVEQVYNGGPTRASQEGLPIPAHVDLAQAPMVPVDITDISDQALSALGATFHSLFARAQWLISQEEGRAAAAEHMERETEHDAYTQAYSLHREQIPEEKRTQPTALEAARKQAEKDAETNDKVRTWRSRRVRHGIEVRELKALANGYDKSVWRIDKELDRRARAATTARAAS